jgi:hypothetical protein
MERRKEGRKEGKPSQWRCNECGLCLRLNVIDGRKRKSFSSNTPLTEDGNDKLFRLRHKQTKNTSLFRPPGDPDGSHGSQPRRHHPWPKCLKIQ